MACFLFPKSFYDELESVMGRFWWQKGVGKKGIHWCGWKNLCDLKEFGGMGFQSLATHVLKVKYFSNSDFFNSVWAAKGLLQSGLCWRVGSRERISIREDTWLSGLVCHRINEHVSNDSVIWVADLIDNQNREWKVELIKATFSEAVSTKILQIPLAQEVQDNMLVWQDESSGEFTVRSLYRLLHEKKVLPSTDTLQNSIISFYKKIMEATSPLENKDTDVENNMILFSYSSKLISEKNRSIGIGLPGFFRVIQRSRHDWFVVLSGSAGINGCMIGNKTLYLKELEWISAWKPTIVKDIDEWRPQDVPYVKFNFDAALINL
ncbi:reverse transcriptase [Gossypium australe]|uniref:Reverse transcriptase n=1 Tax=Gossypium australe TaxID=47621 RepID=A0A5B6W0E7_9ROSI|nr:reverse transcriptase [Gossypium australe]